MSIEYAGRVRESRPLYALIPLLMLNLILLSVQIEDPAGTLLVKKWVLEASAPFFKISSGVHQSVREGWTNYVWLRGAREENDRLHERVRQLTLRDNVVVQIEGENVRLRRLLGFKETLPFETIGARVVGRTPHFLSNFVYIDRGFNDGVREDAPVLSVTGVLGRTVLVAAHSAQVQLITDAHASVGAMVERSRAPGVLMGGGNRLLDLNYINNSEQVDSNDRVVTSGLDGIFPKGLPLGTVVESNKGKLTFRVIRVEPFADLTRIEEVLILINSSPTGDGMKPGTASVPTGK